MRLPFFKSPSPSSIYKKAGHIEWQTVENRMVLIDTRESELLRLNEVGAAVWEALDGEKTSEEIIAYVQEQFEAPANQIRKDVLGFLHKLLERELALKKDA